jgi:Cd(II)/Pb(II)-responsive transcriptional regulator
MKIKDLSAASGVPIDSIRHYEKAGLLGEPQRTANNYRLYDDAALSRLRFIRNCRALDMSLDEVRSLLDYIDHPAADCGPVETLVAEHLGHVRERLKALRTLERQLEQLQQACGHAHPGDVCGIVLALSKRPADTAPRSRRGSVHGV